MSHINDLTAPSRFWSYLFWIVAGLSIGSFAGAGCSWILRFFDEFEICAAVGAVLGSLVALFVQISSDPRSDFPHRWPSGTLIGVIVCLLPGLLVTFNVFFSPRVRDNVLIVGALGLGAPMLGLLLGGFFDRAADDWQRKQKIMAVSFALTGITACVGGVLFFDSMMYGPDPQRIEDEMLWALEEQWNQDTDEKVEVRKVRLRRSGRKTYVGKVETTTAGNDEILSLEVEWDGRSISWSVNSE